MGSKLFSEFSSVSDHQWREKIVQDLKGKSIEDIKKSKVYEGLDVEVFYSKEDLNEDLNLKVKNDWYIIQEKPFEELTLADPIHHLVSTGNLFQANSSSTEIWLDLFKNNAEEKDFAVNGSAYGEAGASAIDELAFITAHLNEYLHILKEKSSLPEDLLDQLNIKVSIGPDYFLEIAKIRALRILVRNLAKAYGLKDISFDIYAENSLMYYSSVDVNTNILRATTACMSAVIGGCDHLSIRPHNTTAQKDLEFGERVARNLQLMMKHEAHLDKVLDPGAGSYFIESLTRELAEKAWIVFQEIESKGGFGECFIKGWIQERVEATAQKRITRAQTGEDVLVGINKFQIEDAGEMNVAGSGLVEGQYPSLRPLIIENRL